MKYFIGAIVVLALLAGAFLVFIYSGSYNISAAEPHNGLTLWMINTLTDNSIEHYSADIKVPDLNDSSMVETGINHYREMCVGCHAGPGLSRDEIGRGLYPMAPNLAEYVKSHSPAQLFWITKNGIKMTGMPAFGKTHTDDKIWAIVSFLEKMPGMTKTQYDSLADKAGKISDDD